MLVVDSIPACGRILIVRLRSLGDCVVTTPALHLLKRARPDVEISVIVEERFAPVFTDNPDVHAVFPPSPAAALAARPHLTLNLHGGPRSAWLTVASLARRRAGFAHYRTGQWAYNVRLPRAQEILGEERAVHTAEHLAAAVFHLGVPRCEVPRARLFAPPAPARAPYAVIHAFASQADKTWPADRFAAVARYLRSDLRLEPVFIGAAPDDFSPFAGSECVRGAPLKQAMTLLSGASVFVGNDSGPAHMAAAFGIPLVVLFGSSHADQWRPWRTEAEIIVAPPDVRVVPCERVQSAIERLKVRAA